MYHWKEQLRHSKFTKNCDGVPSCSCNTLISIAALFSVNNLRLSDDHTLQPWCGKIESALKNVSTILDTNELALKKYAKSLHF